MAKKQINSLGLTTAQAVQLLRVHNPALVFQGFVDTATATPGSHTANNAWIVTESGTIFGIGGCAKGQIIWSNGSSWLVENMKSFSNDHSNSFGSVLVKEETMVDHSIRPAGNIIVSGNSFNVDKYIIPPDTYFIKIKRTRTNQYTAQGTLNKDDSLISVFGAGKGNSENTDFIIYNPNAEANILYICYSPAIGETSAIAINESLFVDFLKTFDSYARTADLLEYAKFSELGNYAEINNENYLSNTLGFAPTFNTHPEPKANEVANTYSLYSRMGVRTYFNKSFLFDRINVRAYGQPDTVAEVKIYLEKYVSPTSDFQPSNSQLIATKYYSAGEFNLSTSNNLVIDLDTIVKVEADDVIIVAFNTISGGNIRVFRNSNSGLTPPLMRLVTQDDSQLDPWQDSWRILNTDNYLSTAMTTDLKSSQVVRKEDLEDMIGEFSVDPVVSMFLPHVIYVAIGRTIELYNEQVVITKNINNIKIDWVGNIGKQFARKLTIIGETVGDYALTCNIYNEKDKILATASTIIKVVEKNTIANPFKIICLGASYTSNKPWYSEWRNLTAEMMGDGSKIDFIGTIPLGVTTGFHEGRSGSTMLTYTQEGGSSYFGDIIISVTGVTVPPFSKKQYKFLSEGSTTSYRSFEVEYHELDENGDGIIKLNRMADQGRIETSGVAIEVDSGVDGDATFNYTVVEYPNANPFWNPTTEAVDLNYYLSENSLPVPDGFQFLIGTNSLSGGEASIDSSNQKLIEFIGYIRRDWGADVKIYVCLIPFYGDQNGCGMQYGTGTTKEQADKLVYYMTSSLTELVNGLADDNIYITPISLTHDSRYNFGKLEVSVNPRNQDFKEYFPHQAVHPQTSGYLQFADIMFSTWIGSL